MADYTIYTLAESQISISGGAQLDGVTQGDGSHLLNETITLNSNSWETVDISDGGADANFADTDGDQTLDGDQTIFGTTYSDGTLVEAEYTLTVQDPDGNTYTLIGFNVNDSSPAYGTVEGLAFLDSFPPIGVPLTVIGTAEGPPNSGGTETPASQYATPPCFAAGTLIDTAKGARPVETLCPGDLIATLDDGFVPLRLNLATAISGTRLAVRPDHRPIRIRRGAIAPGVPARDILVSPQHRVLMGGWNVQMHFGTDDVLVPARHLTDGDTIRPVARPAGVVYHHLVLDRHQIIPAHGLLSESFHPGAETMAGLSAGSRADLFAAFPDLTQSLAAYGPTARRVLKRHEASLLRPARRGVTARTAQPEAALAAA